MYAIDLGYYAYEAGLTHERQEAEFITTASNIGLTTASVLVPAVQTKDILTGIAGGITGVNAAYDDKVLLNKTIQLLQIQMRAARSQIALKIYAAMKLPATEYTLGMAMSDLEDYYRAGTMAGALIDVSNTVSGNANAANAAKNSYVVSYGFAADNTATVLQSYVYPSGMTNKPEPIAYANLTKLLSQLSPPVTDPLSRVLIMSNFASARTQLLSKARSAGYIK